ncbi:MAG: DUF4070 domain-containing protein, partial [Planctomycetes bacterium]|nr:DUF4070 domain-containing protein [Planctomycetota bacterium]
RCEYCDVPTKQGSRPRHKPVSQVIEEIRRLVALGFDSVFFVDDHFAGDRRYARELLEALVALVPTLEIQVYFYAQLTLNIARDEELLALFHRANFRRFFIGIETGDAAQLRAMNKSHNTEVDVRAAIEKIQSYNITVWCGLILGLDGDSATTFDAQYEFVHATAITPTLIGLLQAMPGAPLYDRIVEEGRLLPLPGVVGSNSSGGLLAQGETNIAPAQMTVPELMRGYARFVRQIYGPTAYGDRLLRATARARRPQPSVVLALTRRNIRIIAKTARWYGTQDTATRRMLARVLAEAARRKGAGLEELVYHLVIYKHLRTFYFDAADVAERSATR